MAMIGLSVKKNGLEQVMDIIIHFINIIKRMLFLFILTIIII